MAARSTRSLKLHRKSAPTIGKAISAKTNLQLISRPPALIWATRRPQHLIGVPSAVEMAGPLGGELEENGRMEMTEPVSTRKRLPVSLSTSRARRPWGPTATVAATARWPLSFPTICRTWDPGSCRPVPRTCGEPCSDML